MSKRPRIWLTRPQADSEAFAHELAKCGIDSLVAPVMHIEPTLPEIHIDNANAILLTSRHARHTLETLPKTAKELPIYCVGSATAELASAAGFTQVIRGGSDVLNLLPRILETLPPSSHLLYLAGEETRVDVPLLLKPHNIHVEKIVTYIAHAETQLPDKLIAALKDGMLDGVSFFSPRSAMIATTLIQKHGLTSAMANMDVFCLSLSVAEAAASLGGRRLHACAVPTRRAMRDLIVSHALEVL